MYANEPPIGFDVVEADEVASGWEDEWRSFHHGVQVGRLWVGPPWELPHAVPVVIDPGRAFGTGAHPTTRLTLEVLQELEPASLLDVGCGSGVLSIAAAKLGFAPVLALDVDSVSVEATRENAARNDAEIESRVADALEDSLPRMEVAVVNIALDVVEAVARRLDAGLLVTSGYLDRDEPAVVDWERVGRRTADGWAADLFRRSG